MPTTSIPLAETPALTRVLMCADDALILGHRLSEWCGRAPLLEEELALANIALDLIGQARALYDLAARIEGAGHGEDDYAYRRDEVQWRNCLLVELPNGDFAATTARLVLFSAFMLHFWRAASSERSDEFGAIAAKAEKECAYHLRHAGDWLVRLGDGTEESHRRAQDALDALWMYAGELFEGEDVRFRPAWDATLDALLAEATLARPADGWMQGGGRRGRHSEHLGHLLAVLQHLPRSHPGAQW